MGGATSVLVCFTVDASLAEALFQIEADGLDISGLDRMELVRSTLSELANIVLGHCTADLCRVDQAVSLTAPIVIDAQRLMAPPPKASFARLSYQTDHGMLEILLFGPRESLDVESMCGQAL
jgi:CheY-specific phosphatase CheX